MLRSEAQKRAERARNERTVTISFRLDPDEADFLDKVRGNISRQLYAKMACMDYITMRYNQDFGDD